MGFKSGITNREMFFYLLGCSFLLLIYFGASFNEIAIISNGGKMPIYNKNTDLFIPLNERQNYFMFENFDEVNNPFLTDIIRIKYTFYSVGDFLMFFSFFLYSCVGIYFVYNGLRKIIRLKNRGENG